MAANWFGDGFGRDVGISVTERDFLSNRIGFADNPDSPIWVLAKRNRRYPDDRFQPAFVWTACSRRLCVNDNRARFTYELSS